MIQNSDHSGCTVALVNLGCAKNQVDAETMLGLLSQNGYTITTALDKARIIIVNTCGFIDRAKEESIGKIRQLIRYKTRGTCRRLIVTGCLSQRYHQQLARQYPQVDAFVGTGDVDNIVRAVAKKRSIVTRPANYDGRAETDRLVSTFPWAYLKIAEGCSNRCAYCVIPRLRGRLRSKPMEQILFEAARLTEAGYGEIVLIAQDTCQYGVDRVGRSQLPQLLQQLAQIKGIGRIRLMYCYPDHITDELITVLAQSENICRYLDIPFQHSHRDILAAMGRPTKTDAGKLIEKLRRQIPGVALRSTVIVGYPGETEAHFLHLLNFVREARLDHLGAFTYSRERGTRAARLPHQVAAAVKNRRYRQLMRAQQAVVAAQNKELVGQSFAVLVDRVEQNTCYGRSYRQAPEIDSLIIFKGQLCPGEKTMVKCTGCHGYDLLGVNEK